MARLPSDDPRAVAARRGDPAPETSRRSSGCSPSEPRPRDARGSSTSMGTSARSCTSRPTGRGTFPTAPRPWRRSSLPARTSTPRSADHTRRRRCTGPPAATTSRCSTRSSRRVPIIEAPGSVIDGGTPVGRRRRVRPVARGTPADRAGAAANLWQAAALGLLDRLERLLAADPPPQRRDHEGVLVRVPRRRSARRRSACSTPAPTSTGSGYDELTPLGAAVRADAPELAEWLRAQGAR